MLLPLFPLNLVLFPGMILPLRIFEPRYHQMIRHCLEGDRHFGVVLIKEGSEVGEGAEPFLVGTVAEITKVEPQPDGQLMVTSVGVRRFRVDKLVEGQPYMQAEVTILDEGDPEAPVPEGLLERSKAALEDYLASLASITNLSISLPDEALSSIDMSYLMAAAAQVDNLMKQEVLEAPGVVERLEQLVGLLEKETADIGKHLEESRSRGDFFYRGYRMSVN